VIRQRGLVPSHVRPIPPTPAPAPIRQVVGPSPDDLEHDPGHLGHTPPGDADEAEEDDESPVDLIRIHEEAAWSLPGVPITEAPRHPGPRPPASRQGERAGHGGPPAEKREAEGTGRPEGRGRGRRRRWRGRGSQGGPPPTGEPSPTQEAGGAAAAREGPPGAGRRRRRRRRRP
jgi:hypothetical protein